MISNISTICIHYHFYLQYDDYNYYDVIIIYVINNAHINTINRNNINNNKKVLLYDILYDNDPVWVTKEGWECEGFN